MAASAGAADGSRRRAEAVGGARHSRSAALADNSAVALGALAVRWQSHLGDDGGRRRVEGTAGGGNRATGRRRADEGDSM